MENLGYKEGSAKPRRQRLARRISKIDRDDLPLSAVQPRYNVEIDTNIYFLFAENPILQTHTHHGFNKFHFKKFLKDTSQQHQS